MFTNDQMYGLLTKPEPELISRYDLINKPNPDELMHFGILGMKWGIRRYQNEDGTYTEEGLRRRRKEEEEYNKKKKKWLEDPDEFAKHYDEFTEEERRAAIKKRQDIANFANARVNKDGGNKGGVGLSSIAKELKSGRTIVNELLTYGTALTTGYMWLMSDKGRPIRKKALHYFNNIKRWVIK